LDISSRDSSGDQSTWFPRPLGQVLYLTGIRLFLLINYSVAIYDFIINFIGVYNQFNYQTPSQMFEVPQVANE